MDLDEVVASRPRDTLEDDRAYNAQVTTPPQGADPAEVWVTIPALGESKHGPCRYQSAPGVMPSAGDRCLVQRGDGVEEWWIVQFDHRDTTLVPSVVDALPGSPVDGQEVYFQSAAMATDGVLWHLRYRAASAGPYKWEFLGGSPLTAIEDAQVTTASTSPVELGTGPLVVLPLAGDYDVEHGCGLMDNTGTGYAQAQTA